MRDMRPTLSCIDPKRNARMASAHSDGVALTLVRGDARAVGAAVETAAGRDSVDKHAAPEITAAKTRPDS